MTLTKITIIFLDGFSLIKHYFIFVTIVMSAIYLKITEVTAQLSTKSSMAQEQSINGQTTALEGQKLLQEIATVFKNVKQSSDVSNVNVKRSVFAIEKVSNQFTHLLGEIDMLSAASQQNSAATEEIVSSILEENKLLEAISEATAKLQTLNSELIALTK